MAVSFFDMLEYNICQLSIQKTIKKSIILINLGKIKGGILFMERIVAYIKEKLKSKYSNYLTIKNDLKGLEKGIKEFSEEICKKTLKSFLEDYDLELKLDPNRNEKYVVQRTVSKNITSTLGTFKLNRTRYYDKENNCYFCLLDKN